ncbi:MAG: riboflavin synthase [Saprospiraceae bacterium]|nr:riboflavin synthase [Saprospiraceae bacterium]
MFTGIIESQGQIKEIKHQDGNIKLTVCSNISSQLKIDQSVSHNGVCLTVIHVKDDCHECVVVPETLSKTNFKYLAQDDFINLERAMIVGDRFDGHFVQGHVDCTSLLVDIKKDQSVKEFYFEIPESYKNHIVARGSITINGVSLTIADVLENKFKVAIIPYTYDHTNFNKLKLGDHVNLEFDMIGKYILRFLENRNM